MPMCSLPRPKLVPQPQLTSISSRWRISNSQYFRLGHLLASVNSICRHGTIEHDASISRGDFASGDNFHFNETLFTALAESNPGVDYYNASSAGAVQKRRLQESQASNPNITNTVKEFAIRGQESALYLSVMGDPSTGIAPKEWVTTNAGPRRSLLMNAIVRFVNIFFREERMPIEEGWKRPDTQITGGTIESIRNVVFQTSDWAPNDPTECSAVVFIFDTEGNTITF